MDSFDVLLNRLIVAWREQGLPVGPPSTEEAIAAFERRHAVRLAPDLRRYFLRVNGMGRAAGVWPVDVHEINFYPLSEVERLPGEGGQISADFVLADYLISSHEYVVDLSHEAGDYAVIFAVGGPRVRVADDLPGFLERYLAGHPGLLYPWGRVESEWAV